MRSAARYFSGPRPRDDRSQSWQRDLSLTDEASQAVRQRLALIESTAREMSAAMQFGFLLDPERRLLSIGYRVAEGTLDPSCYDLLASEARLASFVAIAKNDVPARHWFRLGRAVTPVAHGAALMSWSGSMFEYLMPSLVMRAPSGSLLEQTNRLIVQRQIHYGTELGVPWGISESAYNARDLELTYQYSNFGVPGLGLKRGLSENAVIAPYATALAAMVDPQRAALNFASLIDYRRTRPVRLLRGARLHPQPCAGRVPRCHRAGLHGASPGHDHSRHRQRCCSTAGCANAFTPSRASRRPSYCCRSARRAMSRSPIPALRKSARQRASAIRNSPRRGASEPRTQRRPQTHLLSNGRYAVMLTSAGSGYSRWHDLAVTRWREDLTRDDCGSYFFLRDIESGAVWSAGYQPSGVEPDELRGELHRGSRGIHRRDAALTTTLEVIVSPEDDAEVRRRIDYECRQPDARPRGHFLFRARACAASRRCRASGLLKALRADRVCGEGGRDPGDAATALACRS